MTDPKVPFPSTLRDAGKRLWSDIVATYDLRADELRVLENACRASDMIAAIESVWAEDGRPMWTNGSMGQLVEHPASKSIRAWQTTLDAELARLKLPDDASGAGESNQQRGAAQSRWAQYGKGA